MSAAVRAAVVSMLRTIDGTGDYTLNLSAAEQVIDGRPPDGVRPKGQIAYVYQLNRDYSRGGAAPLRSWDVTRRIGLAFYIPPDSMAGSDRETTLDAIADDLLLALANAVLPGGALRVAGIINVERVEMSPYHGSQQPAKAYPVVMDAVLTVLIIDDGGV